MKLLPDSEKVKLAKEIYCRAVANVLTTPEGRMALYEHANRGFSGKEAMGMLARDALKSAEVFITEVENGL